MTVWTISAQPGTPGLEVAAALSARAGVPAYSRTEMVDREKSAREVAHADHVERAWVHALFDVRVDDLTLYTICLDTSRLRVDRIVGVLSAAGNASEMQTGRTRRHFWSAATSRFAALVSVCGHRHRCVHRRDRRARRRRPQTDRRGRPLPRRLPRRGREVARGARDRSRNPRAARILIAAGVKPRRRFRGGRAQPRSRGRCPASRSRRSAGGKRPQ
jgi:hypothetical protein